MQELKPCPFCGGVARLGGETFETITGETFETTAAHWAYCLWCGAAGGTRTSEAEAVAAWNARHVETCRMEPLNAFYTDLNGLNQTEWGVCSNCGTASPIDATYCCECGRRIER